MTTSIFRFNMLCDEDDYFLREYDVPSNMTLSQLRTFIDQDVHYRPDEMVSFFVADDHWEPLREYTAMDMGDEETAPGKMEETTLIQIVQQPGHRLIYRFDSLDDRAFYLQLMEVLPATKGVRYPRVNLSQGDAPSQEGGTAGGGSIFDDAMSEFNDFEGNDYASDEE